MSPVKFKKTLCRPVDFKGQGALTCWFLRNVNVASLCRLSMPMLHVKFNKN